MQETFLPQFAEWLSGFFDAEGCALITRYRKKNGTISYSPRISIKSTDFYSIELIIDFLLANDINCYVRTSSLVMRKPIKSIEISRFTKILKFCNLILQYSITKKEELELLKSFCELRLENFGKPHTATENLIFDKICSYKAHKKGKKCLSHIPESVGCSVMSLPWLAGFWDGDGSFNIGVKGTPSCSVGCTHLPTINSIRSLLDANNIFYYYNAQLNNRNHLPDCKRRVHKLFVNKPLDILKVLDLIQEFLVLRKQQASIIRNFCMMRSVRKYQYLTQGEKQLICELKNLNGSKDSSEAIRETPN